MAGDLLQFAPFLSSVDTGFWWNLSQKKLNVYKLDDAPLSIKGYYSNDSRFSISGILNVDFTAFDEPWKARHFCCEVNGTLIICNTTETFKECDKKVMIDSAAAEIWEAIVSGNGLLHPELLSRFLLLTYVDLKKYHFYYWFAFPALCYPENTKHLKEPSLLINNFNASEITSFLASYNEFMKLKQQPYFLVHSAENIISVSSLTDFEVLFNKPGKLLFGFCDPCTLEYHPGWPLRNFLALVAYHWGGKLPIIDVLCVRDRVKEGQQTVNHSVILHLDLQQSSLSKDVMPQCVGWELNERQKKGPRKVDLSSTMNPEKMAETSVDLNLKLMRWRLVPTLDLDCIRNARCLLLGAGTLGCNVARSLMGWGVRTITFVDNGRISYSNPVRQSLYNFEDCLDGGKSKALAAAIALKRIFPNVESNGIELAIPMPGHFVLDSDSDHVRENVIKLEQLIKGHDVIFLLTDTRESRWLPSVIAASQKKLVLNVALGFDTFLVMRHGINVVDDEFVTASHSKTQSFDGGKLGCYFCNDVVAPGDSTRNRTMDQQCTVTRPGLSMVAAGMAVELMVSILHHPKRELAPAETNSSGDDISSGIATQLGIVPHQIRGFLSLFYHILPVSQKFDKCSACSSKVIKEYEVRGFEFLLMVFNNPTSLEDLSGLTQLHSDTQESEVWELSDDD